MTYSTSTTIKGPSRGTAGALYQWALKQGCERPADVLSYLTTLSKLCTTHELRFEVLVAQSIHETSDVDSGAPWASYWWQQRVNPAGIGITGDPEDDNASRDFKTGDAAARAHFLHLWLYAVGDSVPTGLRTQDDPRWQAGIDGNRAGIAPTIKGLAKSAIRDSWAEDVDYDTKIVKHLNALDAAGLLTASPTTDTSAEAPEKETTVSYDASKVVDILKDLEAAGKIVHGRVPMFGYLDKQSVTKDKPEGIGWDNLGKRDVLGVVLHRQVGSMNGTNQFFGDPTVGALTDYGVGVEAQDGAAMAGVIYKWNDEYGYRSGWASGRVSSPYGDGVAFVNKYGVNSVNKRLVSLEISGFQDTPIDDLAFGEIVHFIAYYADKAGIKWSDFPFYSVTGMSFLFWHQEFTIGTGKLCPFNVVISRTNEIIESVKTFLKGYQVGAVQAPPVEVPVELPPVVVPSKYADPMPIAALALLADADFKGRKALVTAEGTKFRLVQDQVRIIKKTKRFQQASRSAKSTGPDLNVDQLVDVTWQFTAGDGEEWYLTDWWTRIPVADTELFADTKAA